ncbi:hypothetical protein U27_01208 [Candidatus Vecturithrix granuli]|uniref:Uncharacterized protein n=1 Tax=Vecturithrix granuli TaxID=1499967 RepID=A0A081C9Q3_VECG1|nr:hypothetical protein U27_01208 [Candidatus Vecturithrix granuli]
MFSYFTDDEIHDSANLKLFDKNDLYYQLTQSQCFLCRKFRCGAKISMLAHRRQKLSCVVHDCSSHRIYRTELEFYTHVSSIESSSSTLSIPTSQTYSSCQFMCIPCYDKGRKNHSDTWIYQENSENAERCLCPICRCHFLLFLIFFFTRWFPNAKKVHRIPINYQEYRGEQECQSSALTAKAELSHSSPANF